MKNNRLPQVYELDLAAMLAALRWGAEDALADHMRMKLLYDLAYTAAMEDLRSFVQLEVSILLRTPLVMLRGGGT